MNTKINCIQKSNIPQPARLEACQSCKKGHCCGSCWCCLPWPTVARQTKATLDALCLDGYDWLSPQVVPGFAGAVDLMEVCG